LNGSPKPIDQDAAAASGSGNTRIKDGTIDVGAFER
jgi:hypothetical protein